MKLLFGLLISLAISSTFAVPVRSPKDEVDIVEVPRDSQRSREGSTEVDPDFRDFQGVVDTGAGYPFLAPSPHPFSFNLGFFDSFEDIFRRLRTRLWSVGSGESSEEGGFSLGLEPPKGANSTSVVKVVDGHKIEINDTVYGTGDSENGAIFKFRIINIRPLESDEEVSESATGSDSDSATVTPTTPKPRDIEGESNESTNDIDKPDRNEINANIDDPEGTTEAIIISEMHDIIPQGIVSSYDNNNAIDRDTLDNQDELQVDEIDIVQPTTTTTTTVESLTEQDDSDVIATLSEDYTNPSGNRMESERLSALVDAENVNDDAGNGDNNENEFNESINQQPTADDVVGQDEQEDLAESFDEQLSLGEGGEHLGYETVQGLPSRREDLSSDDDEEDTEDVNHGLEAEWGGLDDENVLTNEIDTYEGVPIDLSNDIAVNDIMAADQGAPINPDAEVFDVNEFASNVAGSTVPERLQNFK